jgi:hypothetical protein
MDAYYLFDGSWYINLMLLAFSSLLDSHILLKSSYFKVMHVVSQASSMFVYRRAGEWQGGGQHTTWAPQSTWN